MMQDYKKLYARSLAEPEAFWKEQALKTLDWIRPFDQVTSGCGDGKGVLRNSSRILAAVASRLAT